MGSKECSAEHHVLTDLRDHGPDGAGQLGLWSGKATCCSESNRELHVSMLPCLLPCPLGTAPTSPETQGKTCVLLDGFGCFVTRSRAHPQVTATAPEVSSSVGVMAAK